MPTINSKEAHAIYFAEYDLKAWIDDVSTRKTAWQRNGPLVVAMKRALEETRMDHELT